MHGRDRLRLCRTTGTCARARAHWMQFALAFGVTLLNQRTAARGGRLARVKRLARFSFRNTGARPLSADRSLPCTPTGATGALRKSRSWSRSRPQCACRARLPGGGRRTHTLRRTGSRLPGTGGSNRAGRIPLGGWWNAGSLSTGRSCGGALCRRRSWMAGSAAGSCRTGRNRRSCRGRRCPGLCRRRSATGPGSRSCTGFGGRRKMGRCRSNSCRRRPGRACRRRSTGPRRDSGGNCRWYGGPGRGSGSRSSCRGPRCSRLGCRRGNGARRRPGLQSLGLRFLIRLGSSFGCGEAQEMLPHQLGMVQIERARVCLLVVDTNLRQIIDQDFGLDLKFSGQLVNADLIWI